jgi:RND family efflux transporter MFP subunit
MRRFVQRLMDRPLTAVVVLSLSVLLTAGAAWLWAHEGHQALPAKGASVDLDKGLVFLSADARAALGLGTAEVRLEEMEERLTAPAVVETTWRGHAYTTTRLSGKITRLHIQPGQEVVAGQTLAEVQSLELESLQLELANAENDSRLAAENLKALEQSDRQGTTSAQTLLEERIHHQERVNTVALLRQKLASLGVQPGAVGLPITSPIAGVVIHADVRIGQVVEPQQHLFEIVDLSTVRVRADVLESELGRVAPGQALDLHLDAYGGPGNIFQGKVQGAGLTLDPKTRVGAVWAEIDNSSASRPRLLPGMYGHVELRRVSAKKVIGLPAAALATEGAEHYVFLEEGPGQYARKNVVMLRYLQDHVQVAQGALEPGDAVVTAGSHELAGLFDQHALRLSPEAAQTASLRVEPARRRTVAEIVRVEATIDLPPNKRAIASARLPGVVLAVHKDRDQTVHAGEVIAEIASLEAQSLQLELLRSRFQLQVLQESLERLRPLIDTGNPGLSSRQLRETRSALSAEEKRSDSLNRRLTQAGLSEEQIRQVVEKRQFVETIPVRAPIDGTLVRFSGTLGQAVKADDPLFEIHDLSGVWVEGHVQERDLARVQLGQRARVYLAADAGFVTEGVVRRNARVFDSDDHTLSIWVELTGERKRPLPAGMLARLALIVAEPEPTLAVPRTAIFREGQEAYLFVRHEDKTVERRRVTTGQSDDRYVEVASGLIEGETVAIQGVTALAAAYAVLK